MRRRRGVRCAGGLDPGRRTPAAPGDPRDRGGEMIERKKLRLSLHQRAVDGEERLDDLFTPTQVSDIFGPSRRIGGRSTTRQSRRPGSFQARGQSHQSGAQPGDSASTSTRPSLMAISAPSEIAEFFDFVTAELGVEGITVSPGYAYERAPDQEHFLNRSRRPRTCSARCSRRGKRTRAGVSASRACSSISWPATRSYPVHALGQSHA